MPRPCADRRALAAHAAGRPAAHAPGCPAAALVLALLLALGCGPEPALDYGNPALDTRPTERNGIFAQLLGPDPLLPAADSFATLRYAAWTEEGDLVRLRDPVRALEAERNGDPGPDQVHSIDMPLLHGWNALRLEARSADGRWRTLEARLRYSGDAPGLRVDGVAAGTDCETLPPSPPGALREDTLCVFVTTSLAAPGPVTVDIAVGDAPPLRAVQTRSGRHVARVDLPGDGRHILHVTARGERATARGASATARGERATARTTLSVLRDSQPPEITLHRPAADLETEAPRLAVEASFAAPSGIAEATLLLDGRVVARRRESDTLSFDLPLPTGPHLLTLRVRDGAGNVAEATRHVERTPPIRLGLPREGDEATLRIDRFALEDLLSQADRDTLVLGAVELRDVTRAALLAIREPARYGVDTSVWGPAERNLSRLLAMTPDDAELDGTSLAPLRDLALALGLPPARMLAELLDVAVDEPLLPLDDITDAVLDLLIGSHPQVDRRAGLPSLELVLSDALTDLAPLADRFGPADGHPGFLEGAVRGRLLEEGFFLELQATSGLRRHEGIALSRRTKAYCFEALADDLIEVDFEDPDTFRVIGVVDEPRIDLRLIIGEHPAFIPAGTTREANPLEDSPGYFLGDSPLWSLEPWELERIIGEAALRRFLALDETLGSQRTLRYDIGAIRDAAVITFDRGWVTFETAGNLGSPPPPAYAWDLLTEIAQVRLHDGGLAQGEVDIAIDLLQVPVGLEASDLEDILRPELQAQRSRLIASLLGTEPAGQGDCDLRLDTLDGGATLTLLTGPDAGTTRTLQPGASTRIEDATGLAWTLTLGALAADHALLTLRRETTP